MSMLTSSNPVLSDSALGRLGLGAGSAAETATIDGVIRKTGFCMTIAIGGGAAGYKLVSAYPNMALWITIAAAVVGLVMFFAMMATPKAAIIGAPVYSLVEGAFLGSVSFMLESILTKQGIVLPVGLALQAFVITGSLMATMLALHAFRIIRAGPRFTAVLSVVTIGIAVTYLVSFVISFFGVQMPFLSLGSAFAGGQSAWIGLGINGLILIVAALWLLVDFAQIEEAVASGAPKWMEWTLAFGLIVTLAWVYLETLKMLFRLYAMFGSREE
ncbi:MAG: Bax inhibitor-1/YccA family protein [Planctomycetota bacterium]